MPGKLYLTAIHIGNIEDLSVRCVKTLNSVDFIASEHKNVADELLGRLEINKPVVSCYGRGSRKNGALIISRLLEGESCALITDAGTPAISDPGEYIVKLCSDAGIDIISIPGPCAAIAALAVSGLPTGRFTFEGFLSRANSSRLKRLEELKDEKRTMIFYEAPQKLKATLEDMYSCWGDRKITLLREMTKHDEERIITTLAKAGEYFAAHAPRGEFVLIIEGAA